MKYVATSLLMALVTLCWSFFGIPVDKKYNKETAQWAVSECGTHFAKSIVDQIFHPKEEALFQTEVFWSHETLTPRVLVHWFRNSKAKKPDVSFKLSSEFEMLISQNVGQYQIYKSSEIPYLEIKKGHVDQLVLWESSGPELHLLQKGTLLKNKFRSFSTSLYTDCLKSISDGKS